MRKHYALSWTLMANKRLDLTGQTFGCITVLQWDSSSYGKNDSEWICRCNNCGTVHTLRAGSIKELRKSCIVCKMKYRSYGKHSLKCTECGTTFYHNTKVKSGQCGDMCKKAAAARRALFPRRDSMKGHISSLLTQIKSRAKRKGIDFDLTRDWAIAQLDKQEGRCIRTGRLLTKSIPDKARPSRSASSTLSFDRRDPEKGYTQDNTEIVCYQYNIAKNAFSNIEVEIMCRDVLEKAGYTVSAGGEAVHYE